MRYARSISNSAYVKANSPETMKSSFSTMLAKRVHLFTTKIFP
jgi:hypothetical protein